MFLSELVIKKVGTTRDKYVLMEDLIWNKGVYYVRVPSGFTTDLTTYWIEGKHTPASVIHDYLLKQGKSFSYANKVFNLALRDTGISWLHRKIIMFGVTLKSVINRLFK